MFHPDQIEEVPRMFPLSPCVLPALQYHLSQIDEALKHNDSMIDLHKLCQIPTICLCKSLAFFGSTFSVSCEVFLFSQG